MMPPAKSIISTSIAASSETETLDTGEEEKIM